MVSIEFEEALTELNDSDLMKHAMRYLRIAYEDKTKAGDGSSEDNLQDILDCIFMECLDRDKEWIFDKAQEGCFKTIAPSCTVPGTTESL